MKGLWLSLVLALSACAATQEAGTPQALPDPTRNDLSARTLSPGECGLFVWTRSAPRRFIVFSQSAISSAVWHDGTAEQFLVLEDASGDIAYDQYPKQTLVRGDGAVLTLDMRQPEQITQGMRYKSGVLSVKLPDSWEQVVPVVGLAGCQAISP